MKQKLVYIDNLSLNPNYAFHYVSLDNAHHFKNNLPSRSGRVGTFSMTKQSISKVKNCFTWLLLISDKKTVYAKKENKRFSFKLNFITLTLPDKQKHHDNFIKAHMLEPFLYWIRKYCGARSYIWKAETQKNGNIHFHITSNKFIHWKSVRAKWNKICSKHGYCKVYQDGTNDRGNAATQVKAVIKEAMIARYMVKYFCKNEKDRRPIDGRLWGASTNLNQKNYLIKESNGHFEPTFTTLKYTKSVTQINKDFGTLFVWNKKLFPALPYTVQHAFKKRIDTLKNADRTQQYWSIESFC